MGSTVSRERLLGRVQRVLVGWRGKYHGFIVTDDYQKFFFHQDDVIGQLPPVESSLVTFNFIRQPPPRPKKGAAATDKPKEIHDRAVNIQIETMPG